jgi:predicted amidohydrolase
MSARKLRVAVVQAQLAVGAVELNLRHCEALVRSAHAEHHPDLILLPEAMTSPNVFSPSLRSVPRPVAGAPYRMIVDLARELGCTVGGGFLSIRGHHARHTYVLAEPTGTTYLHDKDEPSLWETNFYTGGADDGLHTTSHGNVGVAMGMEWGRSRTARRLRGKVGLVLGGSCWWSSPNWVFPRAWMVRDHQYNLGMVAEMAPRMARMVGAPCAVAQHVGRVYSDTPLLPGVSWSTVLAGDSMIVDGDGTVLARRGPEEGEGFICADVTIGAVAPSQPIPMGFWSQPMAGLLVATWHQQKRHGQLSYRIRHALGGFPWQPVENTDLPNYNPALVPDAVESAPPAEVVAEAEAVAG